MLDEARGKKLELKLFQAQKELRSALKKSKVAETQRQIKKLRDSRKAISDDSKTQQPAKESKSEEADSEEVKSEEVKSEEKPKKGKVITPEMITKMEKELEIVKNLDIDALAEKALRNKLLKHSKLKQSELLVSVVNSYKEYKPPTETPEDPEYVKLTQDVETRVLAHKVTKDELTKLMVEIELIVIGTPSQLKPGKPSANAKRPAENEHFDSQVKKAKKQKTPVSDGSSLFIDTLKADSDDDEEEEEDEDKKTDTKAKGKKSLKDKDWVDTDFNKYYENEEKKNRPGQRQRRIVWEQMYGKTAKHLAGKRKDNQKGGKPKTGTKPSSAPASKPNNSGLLEDDEMHPSWQAKRLQQEMMSKALSGEGSSNKKIVFDTED
ncbi:hypothetical protein CLU79DRAFT_118157 [Phycomyces nitens]|nr:hypothetical protein CLU79DRAFT_118157 [Phycomyces nitens]